MNSKSLDMISQAHRHIVRVFNNNGLTSEDYQFFDKESPKIMETLRNIESDGSVSGMLDEQVMATMDRYVKNWTQVFKRRLKNKKAA